MEIIFEHKDLDSVAKTLLNHLKYKVVLFQADMGVGKTTLIKEMVKQLGVDQPTNSPTFSLVNEYLSEVTQEPVYHFDLYRLQDEEEAYDMGFDEYLDSGHWCFIEWPDKTPNLIPEQHSMVEIELLEDYRRKLTIKN